jgi:hypothetical protein
VLPLLLEVSADAKALSAKRTGSILDFATPAIVTATATSSRAPSAIS